MLTCLVCGRFDLYTSADLLPVARSSPTLLTVVLDLAEAATTTAATTVTTGADDLDALSLLLAGRAQRAEG
jgi:hypothetical protein